MRSTNRNKAEEPKVGTNNKGNKKVNREWLTFLNKRLIPKPLEDADSEALPNVRTRNNMKIMVIPFSNVVTQSWLSSAPPAGQVERQPSSVLWSIDLEWLNLLLHALNMATSPHADSCIFRSLGYSEEISYFNK